MMSDGPDIEDMICRAFRGSSRRFVSDYDPRGSRACSKGRRRRCSKKPRDFANLLRGLWLQILQPPPPAGGYPETRSMKRGLISS